MTKFAQIIDGRVAMVSFDPTTGWPEVPDSVFPEDIDNGDGTFSRPAPPAPTGDQVNRERDRRVMAGAEFTLADGTVIGVTGRAEDKAILLARRMIAKDLAATGETGAVLVFRDWNNVNHDLTPSQMIELADLGFAWIEAIMVRSWEMKDGGTYTTNDDEQVTGIPVDLEDDRHWPEPTA